MKRLFVLFLVFCGTLTAGDVHDDYVVCIHGFMGSRETFAYIEKRLDNAGWEVINWDYPSRERTISEHAEKLVKRMHRWRDRKPLQPIHFVTHSMGGLVLRAALNHPDCPFEAKIGKAVLLAPPNQGISWARLIGQFDIIKKLVKNAAGEELLTQEDFDHLGEFPHTKDVLVIAGSFSLNPFIKGPNDGTVAVEETHLSTPHEHIIIDAGHKSILVSKKVIKLIKSFFEN